MAHDFAAVHVDFARNELEGGRLTGAIAADQANAFLGLNGQVRFAQDLLLAKFQRYFVKADQRHRVGSRVRQNAKDTRCCVCPVALRIEQFPDPP